MLSVTHPKRRPSDLRQSCASVGHGSTPKRAPQSRMRASVRRPNRCRDHKDAASPQDPSRPHARQVERSEVRTRDEEVPHDSGGCRMPVRRRQKGGTGLRHCEATKTQPVAADTEVIDPHRRIDENHAALLGRRRRIARRWASLPPRSASRRALCWAISAFRPSWTSDAFSFRPVRRDACFRRSSSIVRFVFMGAEVCVGGCATSTEDWQAGMPRGSPRRRQSETAPRSRFGHHLHG